MEASTTLRRNNKGTTLTEMIVTFALTGIFLAAAAGILSSAVLLHSRLTSAMYAQSVGGMLLDKVTGVVASSNGEILVKDGLLVIHYEKSANGQMPEQGTASGSGTDWSMDEKAYMGFRISSLEIVPLNDQGVQEVTLKIKNLKTGMEYTLSRCTKNYLQRVISE